MEGEGSYRENKVKYPWLYSQPRYGDSFSSSSSSSSTTAGLICGFSWPPRSYSCSFCRREFRSAQALGGHMNVHRRDRARLRQSPPWEGQASNLNSTPYNPNPNLQNHPSLSSSSPPFTEVPVPVTSRFPSWLSPPFTSVTSSSPSSSSSGEAKISGPSSTTDPPTLKEDHFRRRKAMKALFIIEEMKSSAAEDEEGDDGADGTLLRKKEGLKLDLEIGLCSNPPENLDLELRLGFT